MTGQPWLAGQVVPEEFFFRVLQNIFDQSGQQGFFWTARGSRNIRKYYPQRVNCFFLFMFIFLRRHYAAHVFDD